jgi:hypothetical protein
MVTRIGRSHWLCVLVGSIALLLTPACGNDEGAPGGASGPDDVGTQTTAESAGSEPASATQPETTDEPSGEEVRFTSTFGPPNLLEAACAADACVFPLTRERSEVEGALTGASVSGGAGFPLPGGGYAGVSIRRFEGTIDGCGSGTVMFTEVITSSDGTEASGTWSIVESSGTEDLAGVAGEGSFTGSQAADGSGVAEGTGTIDCDPG